MSDEERAHLRSDLLNPDWDDLDYILVVASRYLELQEGTVERIILRAVVLKVQELALSRGAYCH